MKIKAGFTKNFFSPINYPTPFPWYGRKIYFYPNPPRSFVKEIGEGETCTASIIGFKRNPEGYCRKCDSYHFRMKEAYPEEQGYHLQDEPVDGDIEWISVTIPLLITNFWIKVKIYD